VYPNSTHTVSPSESSLSPHSLPGQPHDHGIAAFDQDSDYSGDDVSYRLRLLVKNSYFLPPAHSKPSSSDLTSPLKSSKLSSRAGTPTFLDLFRLGKSKSRPSTPASSTTTAVESIGPILRTTSDSATMGGYIPRMRTRSMPRNVTRPSPNGVDPTGRVVVVREILDDLITAAKEAEQDMKIREWRNSQVFPDGYTDVIDPTDAVDLPPPSLGYPFAVQSTATHGLGVQQSVGAADLAIHLPPPNSPGGSSMHPSDHEWRRALLHEAVGLSLGNSPAESILSGQRGTPTPLLASPRSERVPMSPVSPMGQSKLKRALDRRIISQPVIEHNESPSDDVIGTNSNARGLSTPDSNIRRLSYVPRRAETPAALHTPLRPPPRSLHSTSKTDLSIQPQPGQTFLSPPPWAAVRKVQSSPAMTDAYAYESGYPTPQPVVSGSRPASSMHHVHNSSMSTTSSYYTEDEHEGTGESVARPSMALSVPTTNEGHLSFSEYNHPSPALSAFADAYGHHASSNQWAAHSSLNSRRSASSSPAPRYSTMSPPPRASSSLSASPLMPPPRSSSLHYKLVTTRASSSATPSTGSAQSSARSFTTPLPQMQPTTSSPPANPLASRRGNAVPAPLLLNVTNNHIPVTVHSAPPPASPASFFDNIHDGMQDLESSGESSDGGDDGDEGSDYGNDADVDTTAVHEPLRPRAMSNLQPPASPVSLRSKPSFSFSRFGNRSTPNVARQNFSPIHTSFSPTISRFKLNQKSAISHKPISNVPPPRPSFFSSKKSPKKYPIDLVQNLQLLDDLPPPPLPISNDSRSSLSRSMPARSSTGDGQKGSSTQDESLRKLDGLMLQHMEAEKSRMKKIAQTLHEAKS
jgi:hypothetical protein